jgi:hypothetical protein
MSSINDLNLKINPFKDMTPDVSNDSLFWAGLPELKSKIERNYNDCLNHKAKHTILNWGPYGGGKTFTANYFTNQKFDAQKRITHIYLRSPKDGSKATDEFFKAVLDSVSFSRIKNHIEFLVGNTDANELKSYLVKTARSEEFADAVLKLGSSDPDISNLMRSYLYSGVTKTELKKLGLSRDLQTDTDSVKFLSGLLSCFIGDGKFYDGYVFLWIDEMEDLIYYTPKNYKVFSQVLRDLFDYIPNSFVSFLNFTLAEGEEKTIELILGGALWSRITKRIRFKELTSADAYSYCEDLIKHSQVTENGLQPFTKNSIQKLIDLIPGDITPREINRYFGSVIAFAMRNDNSSIDDVVITKWQPEFQEDGE